MRTFNILVLDQTVRGTAEVTSPPTFDDQLGAADQVVYEFEVEDGSGSGLAISARHLHSNSGKGFIGQANLITDVALSSFPYREVKTQSGPLGGKGRVGVTLSGTTPVARVRVWACGRTA